MGSPSRKTPNAEDPGFVVTLITIEGTLSSSTSTGCLGYQPPGWGGHVPDEGAKATSFQGKVIAPLPDAIAGGSL